MRAPSLAGLLVVCLAAPAAANGPDRRDSAALPDAIESPELRALRLAEQELFGRDQPRIALDPATVDRLGEPPAAVTSDGGSSARTDGGQRPDRRWLQDLELPDIPVRWDERVLRFLEFFRSDPRGRNIIGAWLRRERRYGPMIRKSLRRMGMPEDLVYVAMIESGFVPTARSHAGAVGMWQFVRRTGAEYGLEQTHWVDERLDPVKATEAAARFLADLKERFGSWELALAAYNMGYGALLRAIHKYNTNDYWTLAKLEAGLPFETGIYVAKAMATAVVGRNPERFGFSDLDREVPLETETVQVPGGVGLALLARAAGVERDELAALNPELVRGRLPPGAEPYPLRLPAGRAEHFARRWERFRPAQPTYRTYVVRFGESLEHVAERFRTNARKLRRLNELADDERPRVGTPLLVPDVEPREPEREAVVVPIPSEPPSPPHRSRVFYRVVPGDTPQSIAGFFAVTLDELREWNGIDADAVLQPGLVLQLFVPEEVDLDRALVLGEDEVRPLIAGSDEFLTYYESQNGRVRFRYTIEPGDTLSAVAKRFGLGVGDLARINRFPRNTNLRAGQKIVVYAAPERVPPQLLAEAERSAESVPTDGDAPGDPATASSPGT